MAQGQAQDKPIRWGMPIVLLLLAAVAALAYWAYYPQRAFMQAAAVFFELDTNKVPLLLAPVARHPGDVTNVTIPVANGTAIRGLVYTPTDIANPPAIVLLHGVHRLGYDEPRLVAFASALTRCGFQVLTPELPELRDYKISPVTVTDIRASILYFAAQSKQPVSVMGLSFAGGLALMAVADPAVAPHVKAVLSVGGHASFARVADYYVTGTSTGADGNQFTLPPHDYGPLVLAYEHMADYVPAADVPAMTTLLKVHLYEATNEEKLLVSRLTPRQAEEWRMLEDSNSPAEKAIAAASNAKHTAQMDAVSPEGKLAALRVPVYLLHGAGDSVIPPTELSYLAQDIPAGELRGTLVTNMISHVSMEKHVSLGDYWGGLKLLAHFFRDAQA